LIKPKSLGRRLISRKTRLIVGVALIILALVLPSISAGIATLERSQVDKAQSEKAKTTKLGPLENDQPTP